MKTPLLLITVLGLGLTGHTQNLLPNPGFEAGTTQPSGWRLTDGAGQWATTTSPGPGRVVRVQGQGEDQSVWRTESLPLQPGGVYALRFRARRLGEASGGTAVAGTSRINRDFPLDPQWREYGFIFRQPDDAPNDFVRLGQWHVRGEIEFDDAELLPILASHREFAEPDGGPRLHLGQNEHVTDGHYRFSLQLGGLAANLHRPLERSTASFNSDRWVFSPGAEIVYRFALPGFRQTTAQVRVAINHHVAGTLHVQASRDGRHWTSLATLGATNRAGTLTLPPELLPATECYLRLHTPDPDTALQVNRCDYEAQIDPPAPQEAAGQTDFLEVQRRDPALAVNAFQLESRRGQGEIRLALRATTTASAPLTGRVSLQGPTVRTASPTAQPFQLEPGQQTDLALAVTAAAPGEHELHLTFTADTGRPLFEGRTRARVNHLHDPRAGYRLAGSGLLDLWWCESGWKVARSSQPPTATAPAQPVTVTAARAEFEAAQVILRPARNLELIAAQPLAWRDARGQPSPVTLRLEELAYVHVTHPTDATCEADWYPDPLPPLQLPRPLTAHQNFPLWLTFYVPRNAAPGRHTSELTLELRDGQHTETHRVPLIVDVYDFALPRESHLRSALGLGARDINRYHKLTNRADQIAVFERYLRNFAEHRISPYSFYDYAPIDVRFEGEGTNQRARVDFTRFDAAAERWLDGRQGEATATASPDATAACADDLPGPGVGSPFNTFQLPLRGMGGGTFHSRHLGQLEGFQEGTPEHTRLFQDYLGQVEQHLRARGWLDRAFTYWFDEPDPKDYEFVVAGQQRIKAAAPGLRRMMTEQPETALLDHVDIWCALTPEWTPERVRARRDAGEEVWWYICTAPKAPYVTEFIDHPGTELRLWPWQSWQYGVQGLLIWATLWWHSPTAYPDSLQDPWEDPMSWVSGYGTPAGTRSPWGNGDGRFLYPPRRNPNSATTPALDGPINSVRWENLRDGMEDYEYFWLLEQEIHRLEQRSRDHAGQPADAEVTSALAEARRLLQVPETVSLDLTRFTTDPRDLLAHRNRLARMIERLQGH
ncbi:MAG: DUF4091 domain-containing protein [Verrucomicrobiales bacterium]|nr:DUF4091 domain-containing protein [Verrucomicrobiales bacterium]